MSNYLAHGQFEPFSKQEAVKMATEEEISAAPKISQAAMEEDKRAPSANVRRDNDCSEAALNLTGGPDSVALPSSKSEKTPDVQRRTLAEMGKEVNELVDTSSKTATGDDPTPSTRKRGRPRIHPVPPPNAEKRSRGRPRKVWDELSKSSRSRRKKELRQLCAASENDSVSSLTDESEVEFINATVKISKVSAVLADIPKTSLPDAKSTETSERDVMDTSAPPQFESSSNLQKEAGSNPDKSVSELPSEETSMPGPPSPPRTRSNASRRSTADSVKPEPADTVAADTADESCSDVDLQIVLPDETPASPGEYLPPQVRLKGIQHDLLCYYNNFSQKWRIGYPNFDLFATKQMELILIHQTIHRSKTQARKIFLGDDC